MAAYYPELPSPQTQTHARRFIDALSHLFPCGYCAAHLRSHLPTHAPRVESRAAFSMWMCELHNEVNVRLNKLPFDCVLSKLDERWRDGPTDGSCDGDDGDEE
jgi:FAD-linked sulfhydryl oxidase